MPRIIIGETHSLVYRCSEDIKFFPDLEYLNSLYKDKWLKRNDKGYFNKNNSSEKPEITARDIPSAQIIFIEIPINFEGLKMETQNIKGIMVNIPKNGGYESLTEIIKKVLEKEDYELIT